MHKGAVAELGFGCCCGEWASSVVGWTLLTPWLQLPSPSYGKGHARRHAIKDCWYSTPSRSWLRPRRHYNRFICSRTELYFICFLIDLLPV